nr:hypothetical protein CFP56_38876 [Quercus suber]
MNGDVAILSLAKLIVTMGGRRICYRTQCSTTALHAVFKAMNTPYRSTENLSGRRMHKVHRGIFPTIVRSRALSRTKKTWVKNLVHDLDQ